MYIIWEPEDFDSRYVYLSKTSEPFVLNDLDKCHYHLDPILKRITHKTCPNCSVAYRRLVWKSIESFTVYCKGHDDNLKLILKLLPICQECEKK